MMTEYHLTLCMLDNLLWFCSPLLIFEKKSFRINFRVSNSLDQDQVLQMKLSGLIWAKTICKLEDLKVLRRSPDLLNNVKIGQGQLQLTMEKKLFHHLWGLQTFWSSYLNNLMNNPSNSPVISEKQMFR